MAEIYANEFSEIPAVLVQNDALRNSILHLIDTQPMPGKVTEGGDRLEQFRLILKRLVQGDINISTAIAETETNLSRQNSTHAYNKRVFVDGWAERLVRTQYSRFYNQAVMEQLISTQQTQCFVPHSSGEEGGSPCTRLLAGKSQDVNVLYARLVDSYSLGNWGKEPKIPEHPHCTHVVRPID